MSLHSIVPQVEAYVKGWYLTKIPRWRTFHNLTHTSEVVQKCNQLARHYAVGNEEYFALLTAAWFHDTGFSRGDLSHELFSTTIAEAFLSSYEIKKNTLAMIHELILATKLPSSPTSLCQQILCDCDLHHLGSANYAEWSSLLRNEVEHQNGTHYSDERWNNENISFFESHHYFTDFARTQWGAQKQKNLSQLREICNR
jgi:predicted metal-dependent HD superfamily phosphohydrolase